MSRRIRKKKASLSRATPIALPGSGGLLYVPPGSLQGTLGQTFYGTTTKNVTTGQSALFSPGVPLPVQPGVNPGGYPVQWRFPVAINTFPPDRTLNDPERPSFQQLRSLAKLYEGVTLCERTWLDLVPRMELKISLKPEYVASGADDKDYQSEISYFRTWFDSPDKMHDLHSWIRIALREQTQLDELYIYKRKKRGGGLYSLEIIAGDQFKPLLDDWGKIPQPPNYAYQQYPWGLPGQWFTTNEMIHYQESPAADNPYGQSRVERIIMLVNQALRKQKKDLSHFTEGNIPQGMMKVPADATWTPDQIDAFEQAWNALLAGNQSQQVRMRFTQPGMEYQAFEQYQLDPTFDKFLINICVAAYGLSMQDVAFTEDIHKSSGDSQQNVTYRRTIDPLAMVYAGFLTQCMNNDFDPDLHGEMFEASFAGFDEEEDVSELAGAYSTLVTSGILGVTNAGKLLKLPDDPDAPYIGRILLSKDGPIFLDDMASDKMRNAALQAKLQGLQQPQQPTQQQKPPQDDEDEEETPPQKKSSQNKPDQSDEEELSRATSGQMDDSADDDADSGDEADELDEEESELPTPEDLEYEDEILQLLKSDQDEPFSELERVYGIDEYGYNPLADLILFERHEPGGKDHDQKTHGDFAHPAYGVKHDTSPAAKQASQAAAQLQPQLQAAETKLQSARDALHQAQQNLHNAAPGDKAAARAALHQAEANLHQAALQARQLRQQEREQRAAAAAKLREEKAAEREQRQKEAAEKRAQAAKLKAEKAKAAAKKKAAAAKARAQAQKARLQKQAAAAKAKAGKMAAKAQQKAQVAATKAAKTAAKSTKSPVQAAMKTAKAQQTAAKQLQSLVNTIGSKAQLYNALSGRKPSKTWTAQESQEAANIAQDLHDLMQAINSHQNEEDAASLVENLTSAIGKLQGQRGMTQARASVLEKLVQKAQSEMLRAMLADESEYDYYEDEEEEEDATNEQKGLEEKRYTISELLQLLTQQMQAQTSSQEDGTHFARSEEDAMALRATGSGDVEDVSTAINDATQSTLDRGDERAISQEYKRWRTRAIDDVKAGRTQRGFTTTLISPDIHKWISDELVECTTPDQVRNVFNRARGKEAEPAIANKDDLAKSINAVFERVTQRGHKSTATMEG
jgi:hypothetical protein